MKHYLIRDEMYVRKRSSVLNLVPAANLPISEPNNWKNTFFLEHFELSEPKSIKMADVLLMEDIDNVGEQKY